MQVSPITELKFYNGHKSGEATGEKTSSDTEFSAGNHFTGGSKTAPVDMTCQPDTVCVEARESKVSRSHGCS